MSTASPGARATCTFSAKLHGFSATSSKNSRHPQRGKLAGVMSGSNPHFVCWLIEGNVILEGLNHMLTFKCVILCDSGWGEIVQVFYSGRPNAHHLPQKCYFLDTARQSTPLFREDSFYQTKL